MQVINLHVSHLRNEGWFACYTDLKREIARFGAATLGIADLADPLFSLYEKADDLMEAIRRSVFTARIKKASKECSAYFKVLHDAAKTAQLLPENDCKEAADYLFNLLSCYKKNITAAGYDEKMPSVRNLLQSLRTNPYASHITLLGLDPWVDFLEETQQRFYANRSKRMQEMIDKPKGNLPAIRARADRYYHAMVDRLNIQLLVDGLGGEALVDPNDLKTGLYDDALPEHLRGNVTYNFVIAWNETLKTYHTLLAQRAGRKSKEKKTGSNKINTNRNQENTAK
jgi:hypothetical protein